jgi:hypothetical protein
MEHFYLHDFYCNLTHSFAVLAKLCFQTGDFANGPMVKKATCSARALKKLSHTICSLDKLNDLIAFCDENAHKFLAKLWFQNLLSAKLSFQLFIVLTDFASPLRVKSGKTMLPGVAKLWVK